MNANQKAELLATGSVDINESRLAGTSTTSAGPGHRTKIDIL